MPAWADAAGPTMGECKDTAGTESGYDDARQVSHFKLEADDTLACVKMDGKTKTECGDGSDFLGVAGWFLDKAKM